MIECEKCVHSRRDAREEPCVICNDINSKYVNVHDALDSYRRALDLLGVPAQATKDPDKAAPLRITVEIARKAMEVVNGDMAANGPSHGPA